MSAQDDPATVPLFAERADIVRRVVTTGTVDVTRRTSEREETVEAELITEQVEVTRVPIGRLVEAMPAVREDGDTTIVPVVEEVLVTEIRLMLKEEIHLHRVRSSRPHSETVTLREQTAVITRTQGAPDGM